MRFRKSVKLIDFDLIKIKENTRQRKINKVDE